METLSVSDPRALLRAAFDAAVAAADPLRIVAAHLPPPPPAGARTLVVGAGKAGASMARAVELAWPAHVAAHADRPGGASTELGGLVVTRYAHGLPTERIEVVEAGHPVPDEAGSRAAERILAQAAELGPDDLLLVLVSGGGSSLLALPVDAVPMADLKAVTRVLLASGAPIEAINTVRRHLSRIQGGRLAQATRGRVCALLVSDVAGDDPAAIASGPTVPDPTTYADALDVLRRFGLLDGAGELRAPASVVAWLERGARGDVPETPKPGDAAFARAEARMIATARASLEAAAEVLRAAGAVPVVLGDTIMGEARDVATTIAAIAREAVRPAGPVAAGASGGASGGGASAGAWPARPLALVSGGECTVTVRGTGRGGRCTEFLLALAHTFDALPPAATVWAIAADTDGIDGVEDNAGALLAPDSIARARALGLDPRHALDDNDGQGFFGALGDLVVTGPTRTNVNDFRAVLLV